MTERFRQKLDQGPAPGFQDLFGINVKSRSAI